MTATDWPPLFAAVMEGMPADTRNTVLRVLDELSEEERHEVRLRALLRSLSGFADSDELEPVA